jgi:hypothetical protein
MESASTRVDSMQYGAVVPRDENHGAVGAVCRDANGRIMGASTRTINGAYDRSNFKAMSCAEALVLAKDVEFDRLLVSLLIKMIASQN